MFLGHFALGFAAKKSAPAVSLGTLFLAAQFADLLWPALVLLGVERVAVDPGNTVVTPLHFLHYPISHSLVALVFWGSLLGMISLFFRHNARSAVVLGLLVLSHWVLDLLMHAPDLPLVPAGAKVGLGLWNSMPGTLLVEVGLFALGVWMYTRNTLAKNRTGTWAFWSLVVFLGLIYAANVFGPPPASANAVAMAANAMWLLVLWGWWIDRNRAVR